jgi:hypothetical protein
MSDVVYQAPGFQLSRHIGPAHEGADRQRWQITTGPEGFAVLTLGELAALHAALTLVLTPPLVPDHPSRPD